jgi:hypothetical protein
MPRKKRPKRAQDIEARLHDIEASQWDESRMSAIVQRLDTELGSCALLVMLFEPNLLNRKSYWSDSPKHVCAA